MLTEFFTVEHPRDILRIMKVPGFLGLEAGKFVMMWFCGCQVNELNNWMSHAMRTPYYWRTPISGPPYVAGPYSPLWYLINQPALFGYYPWMLYLYVFDVAFSLLAFWKHGWKYILFYAANSIYFYDSDPIDFFVFNLAILGGYKLVFSVLDVFLKIPWITLSFPTPRWFPFPPSYVWAFVLNDPYAQHESPLRYAQLGIVFVIPIALNLYWRKEENSLQGVTQRKQVVG